jgi:lipopolysaccharide transport system ATP-binding protein
MSSPVAIEVRGLGKQYVLGRNKRMEDSLREALVTRAKSLFSRDSRQATTFWALRNVSFAIARGENVGIIGLNGAGKSTLLKILSRITRPTEGEARVTGRLGALLEVGTGFHPDLTGRENVFLYGTILGMRQAEIRARFDEIVDFAEVRAFIDTPVKRYSSGMYVRLAFAVAAHLNPEILLLDEVLAVGDLPFQRKCIEYAKRLQQRNATILFVSHNMFSIKTMCERVIYLRKGRVVYDGPTEEGIRLYEENSRLAPVPWATDKPEDWPVTLENCEVLDAAGERRAVAEFGEPLTIRVDYRATRPVEGASIIVAVLRSDGVACCNYASEADGLCPDLAVGTGRFEVTIPPLKLVADTYTLSILIRERGFKKLLCGQFGSTFHVKHPVFNTHFGVYHESALWCHTRLMASPEEAPSLTT